jgi:hypothetical protein
MRVRDALIERFVKSIFRRTLVLHRGSRDLTQLGEALRARIEKECRRFLTSLSDDEL